MPKLALINNPHKSSHLKDSAIKSSTSIVTVYHKPSKIEYSQNKYIANIYDVDICQLRLPMITSVSQ